MAMAAAAIRIEALLIATSKTVGLAEIEEVAMLMTCSRVYVTDERRVAILRRIVPPLGWFEKCDTPHLFFTHEDQNVKHAFLSKPKMLTFQVCIFFNMVLGVTIPSGATGSLGDCSHAKLTRSPMQETWQPSAYDCKAS